MASGPITSWQIELQNHWSWWLQPQNLKMLAPWKKSYGKSRQHIKKQRHYFTDKGPCSQSYGFSSSHVYGCESWTMKEAEHQRIDAFELWCWRRLLRVPWTARRWNQSILQEISPEYSLEGLMLKLNSNTLATWWEELTHLKRPWCWDRLKAEGEGDDRGWDSWMAPLTWWAWVWASSRTWWWTGKPGVLQSMGSQRVGHDWATELKKLRMSPGNRNTQLHGKSYSMNMSFFCFNSFQLFRNKVSYLEFLGLPHAGTFF